MKLDECSKNVYGRIWTPRFAKPSIREAKKVKIARVYPDCLRQLAATVLDGIRWPRSHRLSALKVPRSYRTVLAPV